MKLEEVLAAVPVHDWRVHEVYSLDWQDGPRAGVCSLSTPRCEFYFDLLDERLNPEGLDDRLFRLSELPPGAVAEVVSAAGELANVNEGTRKKAQGRIQAVEAARRPTAVIVYTRDMRQFLGCWNINEVVPGTRDWFAVLGISGEHAA